jgi:GDP-mannose 4,6-dehydratase
METHEVHKCRVCGSPHLTPLFSLGDLYLSTFVKDKYDHIGKAPLDMFWCENCSLVQLKHTAPQELMYSGHYWYRSGLNKVIIDDLKEIAKASSELVNLQPGDVVLDIGANDGTLLSFFPESIKTIGCEPATNLISELKQNAKVVIDDFWDFEKYKHLFEKKAKVITAIGMFYDMDDPGKFIRDAVKALDENGVFIAQLMTSKPMLEKNDLGNICHEHLEYYSYESLKYLFEKNGLEIFKVEENSINGGSYRLFARHFKKGSVPYPENISKQDFIDLEKRIIKNKEDCLNLLKSLAKQGKKVYGYGASTKGNTILQYYGIPPELLKGIAEIHPEKIGKYTVGTNIPIINEDEAKEKADYLLVLPYAFKDNFINREKEWIKNGGSFIFCTPEVKIFDKNSLESYQEASETINEQTSPQTQTQSTSPSKKKALILGITGQDGSYLAEILLGKGYEVHGMIRKSATGNTKNIDHILDKITLHKGNLTDPISIYKIISELNPDEIYNEADQDHVSWSFDMASYSYDVTGSAVGRILEIIRLVNPKIKYFQPLSSNMFGKTDISPQTEETPLRPQSPYACGKSLAYVLCKYYRDVYGLFISTGIFYNHESPRRTPDYVTRKITRAAVRISKGLQKKLYLGDLSTRVDFGYSKEYMEAAHKIMQLPNPDDFIICTGETHSVQEFLEEAFRKVGLNASDYVEYDKKFSRPGKTSDLVGDYSKAAKAFGFNPQVKFSQIIDLLIEQDKKEVEEELKKNNNQNAI